MLSAVVFRAGLPIAAHAAGALGEGGRFVGGVGGGAADVGVQDRGEVRVREAAVQGGVAQGPVDWSVPAILARVTASAIFTFIRAVPAAAASISQVLAPSPMARNAASSALRALTS